MGMKTEFDNRSAPVGSLLRTDRTSQDQSAVSHSTAAPPFTARQLKAAALLQHRPHKHAAQEMQCQILDIDKNIRAGIQNAVNMHDVTKEVCRQLHSLLDADFFHPTTSAQRIVSNAYDNLCECPLNADPDSRLQFSQAFAAAIIAATPVSGDRNLESNRTYLNKLQQGLQKEADEFLQTNRSAGVEYQDRVVKKMSAAPSLSRSRCSAQKMALETFSRVFPVVAASNDAGQIKALLAKLAGVLPNLEHHDTLERNAARRGIKEFHKALARLEPDMKAQVLVDMMDQVGQLSQKVSVSKIANVATWGIGVPLSMAQIPGAGATAFGAAFLAVGLTGAIPMATGAATFGAGLVPFALFGGAKLAAKFGGFQKQAQGTALYMLKSQLAQLRRDWSQVDRVNQQKLTNAFRRLRMNLHKLEGTRPLTLNRFLNDSFIDPANFPQDASSRREAAKRLRHHVLAPITSRINGERKRMEGRSSPLAAELQNATPDQRDLYSLLEQYHTDAVKMGAWNKPFPENFLKNFAAHTQDPKWETAARNVRTCFARIKGEGNFEPMEEYKHPEYRKGLLEKVMRMTEALATGDQDFVQNFAAAADVAQQDCQNNAFQIFQNMWQAVRVREVRNIKDPDIREKNLLLLAMDDFRVQTLRNHTAEEFKEEIARKPALLVEYILAAEVALGKGLGLLDPAKGIAYGNATRSIDAQRLGTVVFEGVKGVVTDKELFIQHLEKWYSIQDHVIHFVTAEHDKAVDEFSASRKEIQDNKQMTDGQREKELKKVDELEARFKQAFYGNFKRICKNQISEMLNRHPEVMEIRAGTSLHIPDEQAWHAGNL
jgi:hypothetical protein